MPPTISQDPPSPTEVLRLTAAIEQQDGAPPLSDQTVAQLASATVTHLQARDGDRLVGYAQVADGVAEIAAEPPAVGPLLDAARETQDDLLVWSHGNRSRLIPLLEAGGLTRARELHQLRRPLDDGARVPPVPAPAQGVTVRTFVPGRDDDAWLALNAAAFAHHPEQGRWTSADLRAREAEAWFDPTGFLLAERDGELLGFHWTKIHPGGNGEVYVLGVAPQAQGLGLGRMLLLRGLHLLAERGCPLVLLYVDGDNPAALHLYERDGFAPYDLDVQWRSPVQTASG